jgi:3-methyladenine DNA glycosylase/8-oxoguanine DNA glycosylase
VIERELRPRGPYSLALSAAGSSDATRVVRDGVLTCALRVDSQPAVARAWQLPDGTVCVQASSEGALEKMRFVLALDDDHSEFLRRFGDDPLVGRSIRELRGLRPLRLASVAQALLRAFCGQLIESRRAWHLEKRIVRLLTPHVTTVNGIDLHAPPTSGELARLSPAELRRVGLHARRGAALVRICSALDLERLHDVPTEAAWSRLARERCLGPWSAGLVCSEGLGRFERGLVGDLGLIKLCRALGRVPAEAEDTARLLEPYGEFQALAAVYLMKGWAKGLVRAPLDAAA